MVAGVYPKHDNPLIICMEALALHSVQPGTGMLQITCMHHTRALAQVGFTACWLQIDFVYSVYYLSIKCGEWKLENYIENRSKNLFFFCFFCRDCSVQRVLQCREDASILDVRFSYTGQIIYIFKHYTLQLICLTTFTCLNINVLFLKFRSSFVRPSVHSHVKN